MENPSYGLLMPVVSRGGKFNTIAAIAPTEARTETDSLCIEDSDRAISVKKLHPDTRSTPKSRSSSLPGYLDQPGDFALSDRSVFRGFIARSGTNLAGNVPG
jgi:hypothetical protein